MPYAEWPLIYTELRAESLLSSGACESKVWRLSNFDEFLIPVPVLLARALSRNRHYLASNLYFIEPSELFMRGCPSP